MQTFKQIKNRIRSVESTQKVTHAMDMISIVKLRPAEAQLLAQRGYFLKLEKLLTNILSQGQDAVHPLAVRREHKKKIALAVITSDTGLCGGYNQDIISEAVEFAQNIGLEKVLWVPIGRKGFNHFRRRNFKIRERYTELHGRYHPESAQKILETLSSIFLSQEADEVYIVYSHFTSLSRHEVRLEKLLNIETPPASQAANYLFEPDAGGVLEKLIPQYLFYKMRSVLLNAFASEHAARMLAMRAATNNAKELLENLILTRNKIRQAAITKEIMEIISSVEALR